ncbi:MAG TPA: hypothetical protein VG474_11060 [Solirubrobacteraceae bacterium]|nr:hypothetical protein [Solirubrobacteraceae bacterium]
MSKNTRMLSSLVAAGALLAVPATGLAAKPDHAKGKGKSGMHAKGKYGKSCAKTHKVGFVVRGTLVSVTADDPATEASEATVTLKGTSANAHARRSGEIADQDAAKKRVQVAGAEFTVAAGDAFRLKLNDYAPGTLPAVGHRVKLQGKIAVTKKHCAPAGTSTADRYGDIDVRRVTISPAETETESND